MLEFQMKKERRKERQKKRFFFHALRSEMWELKFRKKLKFIIEEKFSLWNINFL